MKENRPLGSLYLLLIHCFRLEISFVHCVSRDFVREFGVTFYYYYYYCVPIAILDSLTCLNHHHVNFRCLRKRLFSDDLLQRGREYFLSRRSGPGTPVLRAELSHICRALRHGATAEYAPCLHGC